MLLLPLLACDAGFLARTDTITGTDAGPDEPTVVGGQEGEDDGSISIDTETSEAPLTAPDLSGYGAGAGVGIYSRDEDAAPSCSGAWFVDDDGLSTDMTEALSAGTESAPAAIDLEGGTLYICPGTWYVNLDVEDVHVVGVDGAQTTILHGGHLGTVLKLSTSQSPFVASVSGITLTGSSGSALISCTDLSLSDALFKDNNVSTEGSRYADGILLCGEADLEIERSTFTSSSPISDPAIYAVDGSVIIQDSLFQDLSISDSLIDIEGNLELDNVLIDSVHIRSFKDMLAVTRDVELKSTTVTGCDLRESLLTLNSSASMVNLLLEGNTANDALIHVGPIGSLRIERSAFSENTSEDSSVFEIEKGIIIETSILYGNVGLEAGVATIHDFLVIAESSAYGNSSVRTVWEGSSPAPGVHGFRLADDAWLQVATTDLSGSGFDVYYQEVGYSLGGDPTFLCKDGTCQ